MQFEIVFDAAQAGYLHQAVGPLIGLGMAGAGAFLVFNPTLARLSRHDRKTRAFCWSFFIFASLFAFASVSATLNAYMGARRALAQGQYNVVEGIVSDFRPMPATGHAHESFRVGDQRFHYSDFVITPGFNRTRSHGGPIQEGLYVRIAHKGNLILRLEIARK